MSEIDGSTLVQPVPASDEQIEVLINSREMAAAHAAVKARLALGSDDADAHFYKGACAMVARHFSAAAQAFATAARLQPDEPRFLVARAAACLASGKARQALIYVNRALVKAPDDLAALVNKVQALNSLQKFSSALPVAERLFELAPELVDASQLRAEVLRHSGRMREAAGWFQKALKLDPDNLLVQVDFSVCRAHLGDWQGALLTINGMIDSLPEDPDQLCRLGIRAQEGGSPHLALQFFKRSYSLFPEHITTCVNLGITVQGFGNPGESLFYLNRATEIDKKCEAAWFFSGAAYATLRLPEKAAECFQRCLDSAPKHAEAMAHLAGLKKEKGQMEEAKELLRNAIKANPKWLQPYLNLYQFLKETDEFEEAEVLLDKAERIAHKEEGLQFARADLHLKRGDIPGANAIYRKILEGQPQSPDAMSGLLFCSNYDPELTPEQVAEAYKSWDQRFAKWRAPAPDFRYANDPDPNRKLRVGYISGDFRQHSVAFFSEPILAHHDHEHFDIFCYANQRGGDSITQRMMPMADHWRWTMDLSDDALMEMIRMDEIDILIDLSNHTAGHRLYLLARKPAPIQMTWIGMPTTTGLSAIDYRITDEGMDPEGMTEHLHSEKLLRLISGWCYKAPKEAEGLEVAETPALKKGHLTFASLNAFGKINPNVVKLWGRMLQEMPEAELYVATGGKADDEKLNEVVRRNCEACGVPLERLHLMGRKPFDEYFRFHAEVDIVLDPFPYNGGTVTAHALWMGVPVLSLAGPKPIHRMGVSMLTSVGLTEFIAQTTDEYLAIAKRFADDIPRLAEIRRKVRPAMQASPLMDGELVTRDLERALRRVWGEWCKKHARAEKKTKRTRKVEKSSTTDS
ncbi:MAG: tetratricopeptide repeat protein [Sulfuricella sp.]|nr:tetratricopeptide repeat protein [Sulfuricella sp.]